MSSANQITPVDYEGFKEALRIVMQNDPRFKDYDFEGSGLSSILKLLSSNSSTEALNTHFALGESHISTAEVLSNVQALVTAASGYVPQSKRAAYVYADLVVIPPSPGTPQPSLTLPVTFTAMGLAEGISFNFMPTVPTTVPLAGGAYTFNNVKMLQGDLITSTFVNSGSAVQSFEIPNKDLDISTIEVTVRNSVSDYTSQVFEVFHSAFQLGKDNALFYLSMNRRGFYQIEFGDGIFSKALADGNIIYVKYMSTSGVAGNNVQTLTPTSQVGPYGDITMAIQGPSKGAVEAEGIRSIQRRSAISYGMDGVAVATEEYGAKLQELYPANEITQWGGDENQPPKPGYVMLCTFPSLTDPEKQAGEEWLKKYSVGSILTKIIDSEPYQLFIDLFVGPTTSNANKIQQLKQDISNRFSELKPSYEKFNITFDPVIFGNEMMTGVANVSRVYVSYGLGTQPLKSKRSVTFDFHREIELGSFVVLISNLTEFDSIKESTDGRFFAYKGETLVTEIQASTDLASGLVTLNDITGYSKAVEEMDFGFAKARPGGQDLAVTIQRNEILNLILNSVVVGSAS